MASFPPLCTLITEHKICNCTEAHHYIPLCFTFHTFLTEPWPARAGKLWIVSDEAVHQRTMYVVRWSSTCERWWDTFGLLPDVCEFIRLDLLALLTTFCSSRRVCAWKPCSASSFICPYGYGLKTKFALPWAAAFTFSFPKVSHRRSPVTYPAFAADLGKKRSLFFFELGRARRPKVSVSMLSAPVWAKERNIGKKEERLREGCG